MRRNNHPDRLTNARYLPDSSPLHIERHSVGVRVEVHWHEFYEMALVISGSGLHLLNGSELRLQPGSLFLLTPADFHAVEPTSDTTLETYNVVFTPDFLHSETCQLVFQHLHHFQIQLTASQLFPMEAEFQRLYAELHHHQIAYQRICYGIMERILVDLVRYQQAQAGDQLHALLEANQALYPALTYMHHHFREQLTLAEVARQVHLSPNYFSERFRELHGLSFQQYLQDLRLQFARSLLAASTLPITEVCYASGFNTLTHFERAFKQKFGRPPRMFSLPPHQERTEQKVFPEDIT